MECRQCPQSSLTAGEKGEVKGVLKSKASMDFKSLKMQASHGCLKNYVIFDQNEGQNTMILHPSWLQGPSHSGFMGPSCMREVNRFFESLHVFQNKPMEAIRREYSQAALSPVPDNTFHPQQKFSKVQECVLIDESRCDIHKEKKQGLGIITEYQSLSSEFHENTEEIDALLNSDDDMSSTGHSPSEGASYCHSKAMNLPVITTIGKRRKAERFAREEVDDADSCSSESAKEHKTARFGNSNPLQVSISFDCQSKGVGNKICSDPVSSRFCVSKLQSTNRGSQPVRQSGEMPGGSELPNSAKRIKMKGNVRLLRDVIPGANLLDTAGVIHRTVQYVKCLQNEIRGLEATRDSASLMHQIG